MVQIRLVTLDKMDELILDAWGEAYFLRRMLRSYFDSVDEGNEL